MVKLIPIVALFLALSLTLAQAKIHPSLKASLDAKLRVNVFVALKDGSTAPVLSQLETSAIFKSATTHAQRTTQVTAALTAHADATQKPLLKFLQSNFPSVETKSFWIINQVYLKNVDAAIVEALAALDIVEEVQEEELSHIKNFYEGSSVTFTELKEGILAEWGLEQMRVPAVWNMDGGNNGQGLIIGNIDTGVRGSHDLLRAKWVGLANYGWLDPEGKGAVPHDVYNHGTHTMGMLVGGNGIGAAPGAQWLACKGYRDDGTAAASTFISCCEYMLCPTDYQGNNRDCSKAPHVVSNSWGWNGGTSLFNPAIHAWNAAGILSSFSAGNTGTSGCISIYSPADQPQIAAVGATDSAERLAYFSSLGPSPTGQLKPEISAPGVNILSASSASDTAMMAASGTSMSCPSATGVLALLKNRDRNLVQYRAMDILERTSNRNIPTTGASCGGISDRVFPNNHVGHGRIDAYSAMLELISTQSAQ